VAAAVEQSLSGLTSGATCVGEDSSAGEIGAPQLPTAFSRALYT
jgi:hypothetical protein